MIKTKNILIGGGIAFGLYEGVRYLMNMSRLNSELETSTSASVWSVSLDGIRLRVDILLKNPSGGSLKVKYPFIKMIYKDTTFASSDVKDIDFELGAYSQKQLDPIYLDLGWASLAMKAPDMVKEYRKDGQTTITIKTVTTLNRGIAYSRSDEIKLGAKKQG